VHLLVLFTRKAIFVRILLFSEGNIYFHVFCRHLSDLFTRTIQNSFIPTEFLSQLLFKLIWNTPGGISKKINRTDIEWGTSTCRPVMSLPRTSGLSLEAASALENM
jgi:hypothetical protein